MKDIHSLPDAHLRVFDRPELPAPGTHTDAYLIGICGTGMGSLAGLFQQAGYRVSGSDAAVYPPMSDRLADMGIRVVEGYDSRNLDNEPSLVVVGNACTPTHAEAARAREAGMTQASLPEALAHYFIQDRISIVVAGTHGKTTTTSLLVHVMRSSGLDPGFLVGGIMRNGVVSYAVGAGPHFIVEGDEYDSAYFDKRPKFMHYRPQVAVVTSMEFDHADIYDTWDDYREAFQQFAAIVRGRLILNADDEEVALLRGHTEAAVTTYGVRTDADVRAVAIEPGDGGQRFRLVVHGDDLGPFFLPLSGRHNLLNTLSIVAVALGEGVTTDALREGLLTFAGIRRRQEVRGEANGVVVVDDFAHHPTAVRATLQATRERWPSRRLVAVFEPRSNSSRRKVFQNGYVESFQLADAVFLSSPPFRHNDSRADFIDVNEVVSSLNTAGTRTLRAADADALLPELSGYLQPGDVALIMSNGGFGNIHERLLESLRAR